MNQAWFYLAGEQMVGPLSFEQLYAAARAGAVRPDTQVCQGTAGDWHLAWQVPGLLPPPAYGAPPPYVPPQQAPPPGYGPLPPPMPLAAPPPGPLAPLPKGLTVMPPEPPRPKAEPGAEPPPAERRSPRRSKFRRRLKAGLTGLAICAGVGVAGWLLWQFGQLPFAGIAGATGAKKAKSAVALSDKEEQAQAAAAEAERQRKAREEAEAQAAAEAQRRAKELAELTPFECLDELTPANHIDELVFAKLKELKIQPARLCSDGVFVRRVYLDLLGTLPTAAQARAFLDDRDPLKRKKLIEQLLAHDDFGEYWALKWGDLLRVKAEFPINLWPYATQAYNRWIRTALRDNMPYDRFVRELLTSSGSNFRVPQVNFYRAIQGKDPRTIAATVALTFMGARADKWPKERLNNMSTFFSRLKYKSTSEWKEEIVMFDPSKGRSSSTAAQALSTKFPDETDVKIPPEQDPREVFADWLIMPQNPWFTRHIANRVWYWLEGRGIVHECDDIRPDNPPANPELINWLGQELVTAKYDLKHLYRLILNSKTYQLSSVPRSKDPRAAANFASYPLRRLEAEVLIDALCQLTGSTESYSSPIPEPFTWIPERHRTVALPDGSITSSFLEMFGRPPRDTGLESERNNKSTAAQRLHLLNSTHVRQKLEKSQGLKDLAKKGQAEELAQELYLMILSRRPTEDEAQIVRSCGSGQRLVMEVAWALINTEEFLHRH